MSQDKKRRENRIKHRALPMILLVSCVVLADCGRGEERGDAGETGNALVIGAGSIMENDMEETALVDAKDGLVRMLTTAVKIKAGRLSGSGVVYEEAEGGLVILTAGHVMADVAEEAYVTFCDGYEVTCREFWLFPEVDCAFLMVPYEGLPLDREERYLAAEKDRVVFDALEKETGLFLADPGNENEFGYRFALLMENWIYVEDFGQYMMILSGDVEAGMSGCGVFDESGCFLGILCGENESGELAVMPYSVVDAVYTQIK